MCCKPEYILLLHSLQMESMLLPTPTGLMCQPGAGTSSGACSLTILQVRCEVLACSMNDPTCMHEQEGHGPQKDCRTCHDYCGSSAI